MKMFKTITAILLAMSITIMPTIAFAETQGDVSQGDTESEEVIINSGGEGTNQSGNTTEGTDETGNNNDVTNDNGDNNGEPVNNGEPIDNGDEQEPVVEITADFSDLQEAINNASNYLSFNYTASSYAPLKVAVRAGNLIIGTNTPTQSIVDTITAAINTAINGLVEKPVISYTALETAIADAGEYSPSDYTAESYNRLKVAVAAGNLILTDGCQTQTIINTVTDAINNAIDGLVEEQSPAVDTEVSYTALNAALAKADMCVEANYTVSSYASLKAAVMAGNMIINNNCQTQTIVDNITTAIINALSNLEGASGVAVQPLTVVSTCVGDVEILGTVEQCMQAVKAAFVEAHPDWSITTMSSATTFSVKYDYAASAGTLVDAMNMCGSDINTIADMSQEELHTLSGYLRSSSTASLSYRIALSNAWAQKMTFTYKITGR